MNNEILYQSDKCSLISNNHDLLFNNKHNKYYLESYPYEPCLYMKLDSKIVIIIHNSFNVFEIVDVAKNNKKIKAITGKEYDIKGICDLLLCAINYQVFDTDISYLEKKLNDDISLNDKNNTIDDDERKFIFNDFHNIRELSDDIFYKEYEKYDECVLDYCIIKSDLDYNDEESHKKVVLFAMSKWSKVIKKKCNIDITFNIKKMKASRLKAKCFFEIANENKEESKPYWYLFLNPPHGCSYNIKDFEYINKLLFPKGFDNLEIFEWSTNWSNYFNDGLEWWGARCISIYDKNMKRFVVIGASATD